MIRFLSKEERLRIPDLQEGVRGSSMPIQEDLGEELFRRDTPSIPSPSSARWGSRVGAVKKVTRSKGTRDASA